MLAELKQQIEEIACDIMAQIRVELVELNLSRRGKRYNIDILADKTSGGITMEELGWLNRKIVASLEQTQIPDLDFSVSVSSPGLDRPLRSEKDFLRVMGRQVKLYLSEPIDGRRELDGIVKEVKDQGVSLSGKTNALVIPLNKINKATQIIGLP